MFAVAVREFLRKRGFEPHFEVVGAQSMDEFHMKVSEGLYPFSDLYQDYLMVPKSFLDRVCIRQLQGGPYHFAAFAVFNKDSDNKALGLFLDELSSADADIASKGIWV